MSFALIKKGYMMPKNRKTVPSMFEFLSPIEKITRKVKSSIKIREEFKTNKDSTFQILKRMYKRIINESFMLRCEMAFN